MSRKGRIMKDSQYFYNKMNVVEKVGSFIGTIIGKIIKNPFRFLGFIFPFIIVGFFAFIYSFKCGWKKS